MASREDLGGVPSGVDPRHSADKETSLCATFPLRLRDGSPCQPTPSEHGASRVECLLFPGSFSRKASRLLSPDSNPLGLMLS